MLVVFEILYFVVIVCVILKIIYDTNDPVKTLGYLLVVIFVPVIGAIIYFSFGVNYRKRKLYSKKIIKDEQFYLLAESLVKSESEKTISENRKLLDDKAGVLHMAFSPLCTAEDIKLLINGEQKFPEVLAVLENAKYHIHIEYYIYADDEVGNKIKDIMIRKAREGVKVRFIYDDFASHKLGRRMVKELREAGVEVYPFYKIRIVALANRMNYRNHRKIIIVDGNAGFIGGINVDDRYINSGKNKLYWRDTHLMLKGNAVLPLQYNFIADWNFCSGQELEIDRRYFPVSDKAAEMPDTVVQVVSSGPDSEQAEIMLSNFAAITSAQQRLYITTPYFIPNESIINGLKYAALRGVDVKLLVPGDSDSLIVNAAACSYYEHLLDAGVRIYRYTKGFVHAKTMVVDDNLSVIGTANMDIRSYDINFEISAIVFNRKLNGELAQAFVEDLGYCDEINPEKWRDRGVWRRMGESVARLVSPLL